MFCVSKFFFNRFTTPPPNRSGRVSFRPWLAWLISVWPCPFLFRKVRVIPGSWIWRTKENSCYCIINYRIYLFSDINSITLHQIKHNLSNNQAVGRSQNPPSIPYRYGLTWHIIMNWTTTEPVSGVKYIVETNTGSIFPAHVINGTWWNYEGFPDRGQGDGYCIRRRECEWWNPYWSIV